MREGLSCPNSANLRASSPYGGVASERPERIDLLSLVYSREVRNLATFHKLSSVVTVSFNSFDSYSKLRSLSSKVK